MLWLAIACTPTGSSLGDTDAAVPDAEAPPPAVIITEPTDADRFAWLERIDAIADVVADDAPQNIRANWFLDDQALCTDVVGEGYRSFCEFVPSNAGDQTLRVELVAETGQGLASQRVVVNENEPPVITLHGPTANLILFREVVMESTAMDLETDVTELKAEWRMDGGPLCATDHTYTFSGELTCTFDTAIVGEHLVELEVTDGYDTVLLEWPLHVID
jgi:hypothetical protein